MDDDELVALHVGRFFVALDFSRGASWREGGVWVKNRSICG